MSVLGQDAVAVEDLRSLFTWLSREDEFRGRVRLVEAAPEPGTLGGWPEALAVALGEGGAVTVLASVVTSWIRHRTSDVTCTMTRPDGTTVKLSSSRVDSVDLAGLGELIKQTATVLSDGNTERGREGGSAQ